MGLTGRKRFRVGWRNKLILQVEENVIQTTNSPAGIECETVTVWRDARTEDISLQGEG